MRFLIAAMLGLGLTTAAQADGIECQSNILSGQSHIQDAASGAAIAPLPYAGAGEIADPGYEVILTGGTGSYTYGGQPTPNLAGTEWELVKLNGQAVPGRTSTLRFEAGGSMGGQASCNTFFGQYQTAGASGLRFPQIGATRVACPDLPTEQAYFGALEATRQFSLQNGGNLLALMDASGGTVALLQRPGSGAYGGTPVGGTPSVNLEGTSWVLATLNGQPAQARTTLELRPGGEMGGDAPCNLYFGRYQQGAGVALSFTDIGSTRRACPELSEEQAYFQALSGTTEFRIGREGDTLALFGAYNQELATFNREGAPGGPAANIIGRWNVTGVLVDGALTSGPELSGVFLEFGADGQFNGQLGCNNAFGSFTSGGTSLSFGQIAVTERFCIVPAPFEAPILALLPQVAGFQSTGTGIALTDGAGMTLITLAR